MPDRCHWFIGGKGAPLLNTLNGFTSVPPGVNGSSSVVIAMMPAAAPQIGLSPRTVVPIAHERRQLAIDVSANQCASMISQ